MNKEKLLKPILMLSLLGFTAACSPIAPNVEKYRVVKESDLPRGNPNPILPGDPVTKEFVVRVPLDSVLMNKKDADTLPRAKETDHVLTEDEIGLLKTDGEFNLPLGESLEECILVLITKNNIENPREGFVRANLSYLGESSWRVRVDLLEDEDALWLSENLTGGRLYFNDKIKILNKAIRLEDQSI